MHLIGHKDQSDEERGRGLILPPSVPIPRRFAPLKPAKLRQGHSHLLSPPFQQLSAIVSLSGLLPHSISHFPLPKCQTRPKVDLSSPVVQRWHMRPEEHHRMATNGSPGPFAVECRHRQCLGSVKAAGKMASIRRSPANPPVVLGANSFNSSSSSYWCPPFVTKVAGLLSTLYEANCQIFDN